MVVDEIEEWLFPSFPFPLYLNESLGQNFSPENKVHSMKIIVQVGCQFHVNGLVLFLTKT